MAPSTAVEIDGHQLSLSNLDKVLYPEAGFTKGEVIDYYARIAPVMLPHLAGRCVTFRRFPNGVDGKSFFEKRCPSHRPDWVPTAIGPGDGGQPWGSGPSRSGGSRARAEGDGESGREPGIPYWKVGLAYALVGIGVGLAGTPASHSLTGSVPVRRVGMASGTADLQRDLGGAVMQSTFGALLAAGYSSSIASQITDAPGGSKVNDQVEAELTKSFASAVETAERYPQYSQQIIDGAREAFLHGDDLAYIAGIVAVLAGAAVVAFCFPGRDRERVLLAQYAQGDAQQT